MVNGVDLRALLLVREILQVVVTLEDESYHVVWFTVLDEAVSSFLPLFDVCHVLDGLFAFECLEFLESLSCLLTTFGGYCKPIFVC